MSDWRKDYPLPWRYEPYDENYGFVWAANNLAVIYKATHRELCEHIVALANAQQETRT